MPVPSFRETPWDFQATWSEGEAKLLVSGSKLTGQLSLIAVDRYDTHARGPWTSAVLRDDTGQATVSMGHFQLWLKAELEAVYG